MVFTSAAIPLVLHARSYSPISLIEVLLEIKKSVPFVPFIPACFAVAALCSYIQVYSIELATPNDEALISPVVSTEDDSIEADGVFEKDSLGSTGDAGDITPDDAQTPAVGEDEAGASSPVSDVPAEPSVLPLNPQISDFPSADIDEGAYEISNADSNRVLDVSGGSCDNGANVQQYVLSHTNAQIWNLVKIAQTIDDGLYRLGSMLNGGQVVDVAGGSLSDSTQVQLYGSNDTLAQYWTFTYNKSTGYYTVRSAVSGKVLGCRGGGVLNGTAVQQYAENGTTAQWWRVVMNADGSVSLVSAKSGLALDVTGANSANGTKLQLYSQNGTLAQKWTLSVPTVFVRDGLYEIYSCVDGSRLIDVSGGSKADDAKLQVWNRNGTLAQKWSVSVFDDGSVLIKGANSGKYLSQIDGKLMSVKEAAEGSHWIPHVSSMGGLVLVNAVSGAVIDLTGANAAAGTAIQMYANNFTTAQAWRFIAASLIDDGYYVVVNQSSGNRVLDVAGGSSSAGARVQLYTANGTNAQKWYVRSLGNGAYSLTAFVSGKALDVPSANASNGASVQQWDWNGSGAQKWLLRLADGGGIAIYSMLADGSFALMDSDNGLVLGNGGSDSWRFDTTIVSEQPYADANGAQRRLVDIAYSTPSPGFNLCSEWISRVFNAAGYGYANGDACDMFWSYCHDSNRANLKVGMIIAVPSHSNTWAGSIWGHIAIYIGDGKVIENIGRVNVRGLDDWVNYYGTTYTPLWGWYRNIALC